MLLPLLCNLAICLWISHIVLEMRDMWGPAGKPTKIVRLQSLQDEIIHRIPSLTSVKSDLPKKNLKHVSIELWHFFLKTLSKVKQKLIRLRAYYKLGLLGLQAKPWCCGPCRGWKEDWNSSNYRVKPIFGQSISYKIRLTPKKILARLFFKRQFFWCVSKWFSICVLFIYLCSTESVYLLTSHCIVRKATRIEKGTTGHKVSFSVRLFLRFPDIVSMQFRG